MARRRKPHDPAQATQAALERRDREAERARLEAQGAKVTTDRAGRILSAYRSNVFNLLRDRRTLDANHHDAASQLCEAWAVWKRLDGGPEGLGEMVDNAAAQPDKRCHVSDRSIQAGEWLEGTLEQLQPANRKLLERLVGDTVEDDRPRPWRLQVQQATGVTEKNRQAEVVKLALDELVAVLREPQRRAA